MRVEPFLVTKEKLGEERESASWTSVRSSEETDGFARELSGRKRAVQSGSVDCEHELGKEALSRDDRGRPVVQRKPGQECPGFQPSCTSVVTKDYRLSVNTNACCTT